MQWLIVTGVVFVSSVDETKPATAVFPETNTIINQEGDILWVIPAMLKVRFAKDTYQGVVITDYILNTSRVLFAMLLVTCTGRQVLEFIT